MAKKRVLLSWIHIAAGCLLGTFIYSPISKLMPELTWITKILVIPVLVVTGIELWNQASVGSVLGWK